MKQRTFRIESDKRIILIQPTKRKGLYTCLSCKIKDPDQGKAIGLKWLASEETPKAFAKSEKLKRYYYE